MDDLRTGREAGSAMRTPGEAADEGLSDTSGAPRVELLAPAGGPPALQAALSAGADAVYVGLDRWSARAFAANFGSAEVTAAIDRAHLHGARLHLALNVLLKDHELAPALAALAAPYEAGLDALIVADLGFAVMVRERFPDLELHASTQLDTHSSAQLELLARLGFSRAILARELSLAEIEAIDPHGLELEVFAHGALCYGYSGDCLLASMVGGRSGNRGRCSQSCRMKYSLAPAKAADGESARRQGEAATAPSPVAERVLSTADLATLPVLPQLIAAGVRSFKIEGRMKDAAYVAVATAVYREAIDAALADPGRYVVRPEWWARLEQSFSRGFTHAHLEGAHARIRGGGRGGHRGLQVGRVEAVDEATGEVTVRLSHPLADGDLIQVYTPWGATEPQRVEGAGTRPDERSGLARERVTLRLRERVALKDRVFRLRSAAADAASAAHATGKTLARPIGLSARFTGAVGERPRLVVSADGEEVAVEGDVPLEPARTAALTTEKVESAVASLGGTPYRLESLDCELADGLFLPVAALKDLRRRAVAELDQRRLARRRRAAPGALPVLAGRPPATGLPAPAGAVPGDAAVVTTPQVARPEPPVSGAASPTPGVGLPVVLRLRVGEDPVVAADVAVLCLDLEPGDDPGGVAAAADRLRSYGLPVRCRTPEVLFDGDADWWAAVAALPWDGVQARHGSALSGARGGWVVLLEYPLQGLNAVTAHALGADGIVASPEVSLDELAVISASLRATAPPGASSPPVVVEAVAFGREPVLHTRDVLGRSEGLVGELAGGAAALALADAKDYRFPVTVTARGSVIFNARVTNLCAHLDELAGAGVDAVHVVQRDMDAAERGLFRARGAAGLAAATGRERFTTGHLFRGVA